jgi:imidazolonepropionase-like amidohydrolase
MRATYLALILAIHFHASAAEKAPVLIEAGRLIDVRSGKMLSGQSILIEGDRIRQAGANLAAPAGTRVIDLSSSTVLPGLIDNHTHILLQGDITAADYDQQLLKESIPYRAIRATVAARTALMNGFTTLRDLETEGAMYADVDVKTAIHRGVIPGPRLFVATRAFAPTGTYPFSATPGSSECRKACRSSMAPTTSAAPFASR